MATYYISPTGNDTTGDGSSGNPWQTLSKAYTSSVNNDTIICKNGTYTFASATMTYRTIQAQNTGLAIFDGAAGDVAWSIGGTLNITGLVIQNITKTTGLAILNVNVSTSTITLTSCTFKTIKVFNSFVSGAGIVGVNFVNTCVINVISTLFLDIQRNGGTYGGLFGILASTSCTFNITGCTIAVLTSGANQLYSLYTTNSVTTCISTLKNTIVYNGTGGTFSWVDAIGPQTSTATYCDFYLCTSFPTGTGVITSDPLLIDAVNANFNLRPTSPCMSSGSL